MGDTSGPAAHAIAARVDPIQRRIAAVAAEVEERIAALTAERNQARREVATLLEAIGHVTCLRGTTEPWASRLAALHATANEIAKRTGYAGGQGDE